MKIPAAPFGREVIETILPHRPPMLLVSGVAELVPGERIRAWYQSTGSEHFFVGHFPAEPIMPGAVLFEALSQAAAIAFLTWREAAGMTMFLGRIENFSFRHPVRPRDLLWLEADILRLTHRGGKAKVTARSGIDGEVLHCEGEISGFLKCAESRAITPEQVEEALEEGRQAAEAARDASRPPAMGPHIRSAP